MTTAARDFSVLKNFGDDVVSTQPKAKVYPAGRMLAFDQSLGSTGWVELHSDPEAGLTVLHRGTFSAPDGLNLKSNLDVLTAGEHLFSEYCRVINLHGRVGVTRIAHELPPPAGAVKGAGTSSLVAAMALRAAVRDASDRGRAISVQVIAPSTWRKEITGSAKAEKKDAHRALALMGISGDLPSNEGQRDALCIAITALVKGGE